MHKVILLFIKDMRIFERSIYNQDLRQLKAGGR
jgi:hypothetical protein